MTGPAMHLARPEVLRMQAYVSARSIASSAADVFTGELAAFIEDGGKRERIDIDAAQFDHVVTTAEYADGAL